jgi:hypothetical protein
MNSPLWLSLKLDAERLDMAVVGIVFIVGACQQKSRCNLEQPQATAENAGTRALPNIVFVCVLCVTSCVHSSKRRRYFSLRFRKKKKGKRISSIFKDESTGSCICPWKLAVAVATYVSVCIVYRILPSFAL